MQNRSNRSLITVGRWLVVMVVAALLPLGASAATGSVTGKVIHIVDGDTFDVLDAAHVTHRIRVSCMDTPEKGQAFYRRAKDALADLISGQMVMVEYYKDDRYRRHIGEVNGLDLCMKMIESGMAWHNRPYERELKPGRADELAAAEISAKANRAGLWADPDPLAPWLLRRQQREGKHQSRP
ncbi:MAG: micrococcal nuclease-like nuclease [bacterium]|jgi:endonuclease YncB( thermonuclease family)|nr:MAG: micrococcal nuclease-like nuclease [bacterium]KAF0150512.1 MAG: micrococcal nuclease-like nuclease [bacterium]TXT32747.1 MAG: micrococcal nuclease-like nuclease [Rhodocyclaceae bacterium]